MKLEAIKRLRPNAEYVLRGDELEWLDKKQSKPTEKEIADEIAYLESDEYKRELELAEIETKRRNAYQKESDPLFFKYQRGEIAKSVWVDKVNEIRERIPKP